MMHGTTNIEYKKNLHGITIWTLHATQITNESCHIRTVIRNTRCLPSVVTRYNACIITFKNKLAEDSVFIYLVTYLFKDLVGIPNYTASNE